VRALSFASGDGSEILPGSAAPLEIAIAGTGSRHQASACEVLNAGRMRRRRRDEKSHRRRYPSRVRRARECRRRCGIRSRVHPADDARLVAQSTSTLRLRGESVDADGSPGAIAVTISRSPVAPASARGPPLKFPIATVWLMERAFTRQRTGFETSTTASALRPFCAAGDYVIERLADRADSHEGGRRFLSNRPLRGGHRFARRPTPPPQLGAVSISGDRARKGLES